MSTQIIPPPDPAAQSTRSLQVWTIPLQQLPPLSASPGLILPQLQKWEGEPGTYLLAPSAAFAPWSSMLLCLCAFQVNSWELYKKPQDLRNERHGHAFAPPVWRGELEDNTERKSAGKRPAKRSGKRAASVRADTSVRLAGICSTNRKCVFKY